MNEGGTSKRTIPGMGLLLRLRWLAWMRPNPRQAMFAWALVIGIVGALVAMIFQMAAEGLLMLFTDTDRSGDDNAAVFGSISAWRCLLVPVIGAVIAGAIYRLGSRLIPGKSTDYMEAVALGDGVVPTRSSIFRALSSLFSISSGAAIGREGPLVQLASMVASNIGRFRTLPAPRRRLLVACGAAAGLSFAYNTPIAGALFVAEIVIGSLSMEILGPLMLASVAAAAVTRFLQGSKCLYAFETGQLQGFTPLLAAGMVGILCGCLSHPWISGLQSLRRIFASWHMPTVVRFATGGLAVGILAVNFPEVVGNGAALIKGLLSSPAPDSGQVLLLAGVKVLAVGLVFASGAVGGVLTPTLFCGASAGTLVGLAAGRIFGFGVAETHAMAAIGMACFFAAAARAPITGLFLVFEMTLAPQLLLPLAMGVVVAHYTSRAVNARSMYEETLRSGPRSVLERPLGEVLVRDIMRPAQKTLPPDAGFRDLGDRFLNAPEHVVWISDAHGRFMGTVAIDDIKPFLKDPMLADAVIAADVLSEDLPCANPGQRVVDVLGLFADKAAGALPVTDPASGKLMGELSRMDLLLVVSELSRRESLTTT